MEVVIDADRFYARLLALRNKWLSTKSGVFNNADALVIPMGVTTDEELTYSKAAAIHLYLLGYEFSDSLMVLTKTTFYFIATSKKCGYLQLASSKLTQTEIQIQLVNKSKDDIANTDQFMMIINAIKKQNGSKLGSLLKFECKGTFIPLWSKTVEDNKLEVVDISNALGVYLATKDDQEVDLCKRASILNNKVMKHAFIQEMEDIIDKNTAITHEKFALKLEGILQDPNLIDIKVAKELVDSCYTPIIQSGGKYDIRVSAQSNADNLSPDLIVCSMGARYKGYCANLSRTFMIDPCPTIESTYAALLATFDRCLERMTPGAELKDVYENAVDFLNKSHPNLVPHLPKNLGFAIGLEFRDPTLVMNATNATRFAAGMVFNLSVGFQNVAIPDKEKPKVSESLKAAGCFSLLIADTVCILPEGIPDIFTKASKDFDAVSYNLSGDANKDEAKAEPTGLDSDGRRTLRARDDKIALESAAQQRAQRQVELMEKKLKEALKRMEAKENGEDGDGAVEEAVELQAYRSPAEYPKDTMPHQVKVDLDKECVIVPINGQPVPFHISTIKSIIMPDPDKATYLRINFYSPGSTLPKDAPKNIQKLVLKHGDALPFIKDLTFRSLDPKNLANAYRLFQELRKRVRQREQKAEQEKHLVVQDKLVRLKDQRVPRLQDLTMRPQITGRKCVGTLEAHENGLRFVSTRGEALDVMYSNVKHAVFQPCERSTMVVIHFHLKEFIMIGKKKQKDVQFYTEVIDASLNLDGARRSSYDPDEIENEQQEREMKKRLNAAFKDFCKKVQKLAQHFEFDLEFDIPYVDLGFYGCCNKEMVFIQPTVRCIVNLTETPFFVVDLAEVEHVHFERVMFSTKNFDMTFLFKNHDVLPKTITAIEIKSIDAIQEWLSDVDVTYTSGGASMNWVMIMKSVREDDRFYFDTDEDGEKKPAGWMCLSAEADEEGGSEDSVDEDSNFEADEESSEEESEDDDDDESDFDDEDDDDDDEEEEDEEGEDWEELEKEALASDKAKRQSEVEADRGDSRKKPRR